MQPHYCMPDSDENSSDYLIDERNLQTVCKCNNETKGPEHHCLVHVEPDEPVAPAQDGHTYAKAEFPTSKDEYCCTCGTEIEKTQLDVECRDCSCIHHDTCQETTREFNERTGVTTNVDQASQAHHDGGDANNQADVSNQGGTNSGGVEDFVNRLLSLGVQPTEVTIETSHDSSGNSENGNTGNTDGNNSENSDASSQNDNNSD